MKPVFRKNLQFLHALLGVVILIASGLFSNSAYGETVSLEMVLDRFDQSPDVKLAEINHSIDTADVERHTEKQNWILFGGADVAQIDEAVTANQSRRHTDINARIGIRYPFAGGERTNEKAQLNAQANAIISEIQLERIADATRAKIAEAYGEYWAAQNKVALCNAYNQYTRNMLNIMNLRQKAGLLLESDRQQFLADFERINYIRLQQHSLKTQALDRLRRLTGVNWPAFQAVDPQFHIAPMQAPDSDFIRADHPELRILNAELEAQRKQLQNSKRDRVYADFFVSTGVTNELSGPSGYQVNAGVNFNMPLFYGSYTDADNDYVNASLRKSEFLYQQRNGELIEQARLLETLYRDYTALLQLNISQWNAMSRVVVERSKRATRLDGDVLSQLVASINRYFTQSIGLIDTQLKLWNTQARLHQYPLWMKRLNAEERIAIPGYDAISGIVFSAQTSLDAATGSKQIVPTSPPKDHRYSVYLWHSHDALDQSDPTLWQQLHQKHIGRILLSLDSSQIEQAATNPNKIEQFLTNARKNDIAVDLLLGDPQWALPEYREKLLEIISKLGGLPFDRLNLDIEPDSLTSNVTKPLLRDWLETLRISAAKSPWPISITLHHRYLSSNIDELCVPCELVSFGIHDVYAMVFVTNPRRVIEIVEPVLTSYPKLNINVAQSFERHLSPHESYASFSTRESLRRLTQIQRRLAEAQNFSGITIQSWSNFRNTNK